ncbi:MAG: hypothetical protein ACLR5F_13345 [Faecalibacterium sp.]
MLSLLQNGSICASPPPTPRTADAIDFELTAAALYPRRCLRHLQPGDKLITSFAAVIATGAVALFGLHHHDAPAHDPSTPAIF